MKRRKSYWIIMMAVLLSLILAACGDSSTGAATNAATEAETTAATEAATTEAETTEAETEAEVESSLSVWLVNHTGQDLSAIYVAPVNDEEWGENRISGIMSDGDKCQIILSGLTEEILSEGFNALGLDADGYPYLDYAEAEWTFQLADGDYIVLLPGDPEIDVTDSYNKADYEEIVRAYAEAGGILDQTIRFPGNFKNVVIDYPSTLKAFDDMADDTLMFIDADPQTEEDTYANIVLAFIPIGNENDQYLEQGAGTAKLYMKHMLDQFLAAVYGNNLIKSISTDFVDGGDYYGMNSYVWLDNTIFGAAFEEPARGCMEVRYFGPTGYALVGFTTAMNEKFQDYCETFTKILNSCSYTTGWTTSPKAVPQQPELKSGTAAVPAQSAPASSSKSGSKSRSNSGSGSISKKSDSGDYGTPYYWYDEDGDIWYWNGYENEFIGFGDHYYIDDDGQYYESNDWTPYDWEEDDWYYYDDYDPWSDPGDLYDYEEYSDSGDYGTDYSWYDEDGDVWYWNGYEDEYVGSGDNYYIDDDGQYYENNDYDPDLDYGDYYYDDGYDDYYYDDGYDDYYYDDGYDDYYYDDGYDDYGYDW